MNSGSYRLRLDELQVTKSDIFEDDDRKQRKQSLLVTSGVVRCLSVENYEMIEVN